MPILRFSRLALAAALVSMVTPLSARAAAEAEAAQAAATRSAETLSGAYLAAKAAQAEGALDIAADYFDDALAIDPNSELLRQEAMFAYLAEGRFEEGAELAAGLVDDVDSGKVARIALGIEAVREGRVQEALELLSLDEPGELDQLLIGHLSAWAEAGDGRFEDAVRRIDEIGGSSWFPIFNLYQKGLLFSLDGQEAEARRVLGVLIDDAASVQTSPDAYLAAVEALARLEARAGDAEAALATIERGLELAPTYDPLLYLQTQIEDAPAAAATSAPPAPRQVTVEPGDSLWRIAERVYGEGGRFGALVSANAKRLAESNGRLEPGEVLELPAEDAVAVRPDIEAPVANTRDGAAEALYILGQAINRGDGQQVAILYFQFADAVSETVSPKLLTALAGTAERASRIDRAIEYYEQIPETSAYRRTAELQMGLDLWYADRKEEARAHLEKAVETYPDDLQAHLAYADVLSAEKEYPRAAEVLERAIEIAPDDAAGNWNIYYQRGIAYERMKEWDRAEPNFRKALELSPDQPQVLNYLGYSWVDMNRNLDEGLEMIRTAVDLRPNDGYIVDSLGWAYYRLERFDDAVEQLERAVLITPADPTINDHLGDAYWRVGREREARFQWERALTGTPEPEPDVAAQIRIKLNEGLGPVGSDVGQDGETVNERASNEAEETGVRPN